MSGGGRGASESRGQRGEKREGSVGEVEKVEELSVNRRLVT